MELSTQALTTQTYQYYSKFNLNFSGEKLAFFKVEEVLFLLAEADLRGWNVGGTAEDFYNAGIKEFFTKHAFSDASYNEYMSWKGMGNLGVSPQIKEEAIYKDFLDSDNNLPLWGGYYMLTIAMINLKTQIPILISHHKRVPCVSPLAVPVVSSFKAEVAVKATSLAISRLPVL